MAERGARPHVHPVRKWLLHAVRRLFTPLEPDHYLEMINPLWSTRELRGRVDRVVPECEDTASIMIRPAYDWPGHKPGQYVRLGVIIDGVYHWRAYSLTSDPDPRDGLVSVTPKLVEGGVVSPYLVRKIAPGDIVRLGEIEGVFTLPDPVPARLLFVSAGSGITPIMSMLRSLDHRDLLDDVVVVHTASTPEQVVFSSDLHDLDARHPGVKLEVWISGEKGRITPADLDEICPDWRDRETFVSGPRELLDVLEEHWNEHGDPERFHLERFQPVIGGECGKRRGRHHPLPRQRTGRRVRRGNPDPGCGRERRPQVAVRLPYRHLPHLRGDVAFRATPGPANRRGERTHRGFGAYLHPHRGG